MRLDDNLLSHILNRYRTQVSRSWGIFFVTWQIQPPKSCPFNPRHVTPFVHKKHWHFFLMVDQWHCPMAGWWHFTGPGGPYQFPMSPRSAYIKFAFRPLSIAPLLSWYMIGLWRPRPALGPIWGHHIGPNHSTLSGSQYFITILFFRLIAIHYYKYTGG